jgi:hypothetical protein
MGHRPAAPSVPLCASSDLRVERRSERSTGYPTGLRDFGTSSAGGAGRPGFQRGAPQPVGGHQPCVGRTSGAIGDVTFEPEIGLSRRRSRVRVPSLPPLGYRGFSMLVIGDPLSVSARLPQQVILCKLRRRSVVWSACAEGMDPKAARRAVESRRRSQRSFQTCWLHAGGGEFESRRSPSTKALLRQGFCRSAQSRRIVQLAPDATSAATKGWAGG